MPNLNRRIENLSRAMRGAKGGRCELCWNRPDHVLVDAPVVLIPDNGRGDGPKQDPRQPSEDTGEPCPRCGWQPKRTVIEEIVIYERESAA